MSTCAFDPDFYDLVTDDSMFGDLDWYRQQVRAAGGPVLELGAGTGRITLPLARDGHTIHALDIDAHVLAALERKAAALAPDVRRRVTVVRDDMRSFALAARFAIVIVPFRAFLHNLTDADRLACLAAVRAHLGPRGRLALNVFHPALTIMARHAGPLEGVWRSRGTWTLPDGGFLVRSEANRYDTVAQRVHSLHRYERFDAGGDLTRTFVHRLELAYLYPPDLRRLLEQSGFVDITIAGGPDGRPFANDTDELFVTAAVAETA